ncbi:MAG: gluconeogenesis factor YvcK family protein [bacterium]|jgi:uncharacterized cofD-like protein
MKSFLKWMYPGLGIKRWFFLFLGGVGLGSYGLAMVLPIPLPPTSPLRGILFIGLGIVLAMVGLRQTFRSLLSVILPPDEERLVDVIYRRRHLGKGPKIVTLGGGTGLSVLLRGLKEYTGNITAIVTVTDTGGSSGRLREELGILPPGDIRNCLVALADTEPLMESLFQHRFQTGEGLAGHNLGNLFLAGLTEILGDFSAAVRQASRVLAVQGQVLPSTLENVTLQAELATGETVIGETNITSRGGRIRHLSLKPEKPHPVLEAVEAIKEADAIVLGPGSLYTSVLPNLLVEELAEAIRLSRAPCIYVCNVMTQWGETDGYTAADHLQALQDHVAAGLVDYIIVNTEAVPPRLLARYREEKAYPVRVDLERLQKLGVKIIRGNFISYTNFVRHDPVRLARAIMKLVVGSYFRKPISGKR